MKRSPLKRILKIIEKKSGFSRPNTADVLFEQDFHHVKEGGDCSSCETSKEKKVVYRESRDNRYPVVHRGLILSGSGVIKNPLDRERLRRGHKDAICYEMEAAGIMDEIPCLVIRGICYYADTHKQDGWHHYAAAVAAAYCKAIIGKVDHQDVEQTSSMHYLLDRSMRTMQQNQRQVASTNSLVNPKIDHEKVLFKAQLIP
jgi:hypothetical protein